MIREIMAALLRQIGDTRRCPHCGESFIPNDGTARIAELLWQKLRRKKEITMSCKNALVEIKAVSPMFEALPSYAKPGDAGMDVYACIEHPTVIAPGAARLIPLGFAMHLANENLAAFLMPRSGKGHKEGIVLGNLVGVIDSEYQGEVKASIWNRNLDREILISPGDYIAQMVIVPIVRCSWKQVAEFGAESERAEGGFGSTR